ncbi:MAG: WD40/YVTN/BNR-like repeat-containing protein [Candidatus Binataceae bacterium]
MAIGLSHGGSTIYSSSSPSREILVATVDGIVTLERPGGMPGSQWRIAKRTLHGSHISAIIAPEPDFVLAGIFKGGLMLSRDGGSTWERRDSGIIHNDIYSLAATRLGGRLRLFAGTEPAHFYASDDRGLNWREMPALRAVPGVPRWTFPAPPHIGHVKYISIAPDDPATVYACIEQGGMLKSTDAGETWNELAGFDDDVHRMLIPPHNPKRMYLVSGIGMYVSDDGGGSWERRTDHDSPVGGYPDQLAFVPSRPDLMIASGAKDSPGAWRTTGFAGSRITRSRDGGRTWEMLRGGLPSPERWQSAIEAMCLEEWGRTFSVFAATTAGEVYASDNGGDNWSLIASGLAPISKGDHYRLLEHAA